MKDQETRQSPDSSKAEEQPSPPRRFGPSPWETEGPPQILVPQAMRHLQNSTYIAALLARMVKEDPELLTTYRGDDPTEALMYHLAAAIAAAERLHAETMSQLQHAPTNDPRKAVAMMQLGPMASSLLAQLVDLAHVGQSAHLCVWQQYERPNIG